MNTTYGPSSNEQLAKDLAALFLRVRRTEQMLRGVGAIIVAITNNDLISYSRDDELARNGWAIGGEMMEFVALEIEEWRKAESELDFASDDIWTLSQWADDGRLTYRHKDKQQQAA